MRARPAARRNVRTWSSGGRDNPAGYRRIRASPGHHHDGRARGRDSVPRAREVATDPSLPARSQDRDAGRDAPPVDYVQHKPTGLQMRRCVRGRLTDAADPGRAHPGALGMRSTPPGETGPSAKRSRGLIAPRQPRLLPAADKPGMASATSPSLPVLDPALKRCPSPAPRRILPVSFPMPAKDGLGSR